MDLEVEREDRIAIIAINRPQKRNSITLGMWRELARLAGELGRDAGLRAVIITGRGGYFCAGADISEFKDLRSDAKAGAVYEDAVVQCTLALQNCSKPTIAAISGFCIGGGVGLALACDFKVADKTASFGIPAARLGIVYNRFECQNVINAVGLARAKRILFSAERITAEQAAEMGMVDRLTSGDVVEEARAFAKPMLDSAPLSVSGVKLILNALATGEADKKAKDIAAAMHASIESEDYKEGVRAFAEKRTPRFAGR
jgi:enoyl-CoA hydratase/carnithine racemase